MKQATHIYMIILISFVPRYASATKNPDAIHHILVINSYSIEVGYSNRLVRNIERKLMDVYPKARIHTGNLNIDRAVNAGAPQLALRSILWSFVDDASDESIAQSPAVQSIFPSSFYPDVIIFIGLDGLLFYQFYGHVLRQWRDIPLVVCSLYDSVIDTDWSTDSDYTDLVPLEIRRETTRFFPSEVIPFLKNENLPFVPCEDENLNGYMLTQTYKLTGIKSSLPVSENLNLIYSLLPGLKEIVWIDNDFYESGYARFLIEQEMNEIMPEVNFTTIKHTKINSDSLFNDMLRDAPGRAFLTYSWSINGIYSKHTESFLNDIFNKQSTVPLFSLTKPESDNNYQIGGYYRPQKDFVDKTVDHVCRILQGEPANSIPFETVNGGKAVLNKFLLDNYGIRSPKTTPNIDVQLVNIPPTFCERHEKKIWGGGILIVILAGLWLLYQMWKKQNQLLREDSQRYKGLSGMLEIIYEYASADFAIYDESGDVYMYNINSKDTDKEIEKVLSRNLFFNPFLDPVHKEAISNQQEVDIEIVKEAEDKFSASFVDRNIYQLIILPLKSGKYVYARYFLLLVNHTPVMRERTEKERLESLINFASEFSNTGMAYYNPQTNKINATQSWYKNLNENPESTTLPEYKNLLPEDRSILLEFREKAKKGSKESLVTDIRIGNNEGTEMHWIRQYLFANQWVNNMVVELNINIDLIKKEEELLYKAKEKAESSNHEMQDFLSNINHEIRTPLNSIVGFSAFLAASDVNEDNQKYAKIIHRANVLLSNLFEDIMLLSQIDSGKVVFRSSPVNLNIVFIDLAKYTRSILFEKKLDIICDIPGKEISIRIDFFYFNKLMLNLLNNAIKFTEKGSVVLGFREETDYYFFYVKDTGCGIDDVHQQLIFKRFTKLDPFVQGTGLGLALCKRIVENLGGEMGMNSRLGKGTTFWFTVPQEPVYHVL